MSGALMCDGKRDTSYQWWSDSDDDGSGGGGRDVRGEVVSDSSRSCSLMTGLQKTKTKRHEYTCTHRNIITTHKS